MYKVYIPTNNQRLFSYFIVLSDHETEIHIPNFQDNSIKYKYNNT